MNAAIERCLAALVLLLIPAVAAVALVMLGYRWAGLSTAAVSLVVVLSALALWEYVVPCRPRLPKPTGHYPVGQAEVRLGAASALWFYPSVASAAAPARYLQSPNRVADALGWPRLLFRHLGRLKTAARVGANAAPTERPTVVYIHGAMGFAEDQTTLCIELASHGYSVIALRVDLSPQTLGIDASGEADFLLQLQRAEIEILPEIIAALAVDIEQFKKAPQFSSNDNGWVLMGHSLGGGVAGALARCLAGRGEQVYAWVNLDGQVLEAAPEAAAQLHLSQGVMFDPVDDSSLLGADYGRRIRGALCTSRGVCRWLRFADAGHGSFTDLPMLIRPLGPLTKLLGRDPSIHEKVRALVLTFLHTPDQVDVVPGSAFVVEGNTVDLNRSIRSPA